MITSSAPNVYALGASKNIGYFASLRLLEKGASVTFLLRNPSVFDSDKQIQEYVSKGKVKLVKGDGLSKEDVKKGWDASTELGGGKVDLALSSIGGLPKFSITGGFIMDPPDLVTHSFLNLLLALSTSPSPNNTKLVAISSTGLTKKAHASLPLLLKPLYGFLLKTPHEDKLGLEKLLSDAAGWTWDTTQPISPNIVPHNYQDQFKMETFKWENGWFKNFVILRPALLTDGECRADVLKLKEEKKGKKKDKKPYRISTEESAVADGYSISRKDVAHFIVEGAVANWDDWTGKVANLAY
ncbi:hypothetical protein ABKN59_012015 [Abortiporus biennis]